MMKKKDKEKVKKREAERRVPTIITTTTTTRRMRKRRKIYNRDCMGPEKAKIFILSPLTENVSQHHNIRTS